MKKQVLATIVGAMIIFIWQFLSWALIPIHTEAYGYTPNQDKIMEVLNENLTEAGTYMMPSAAPSATAEEHQAAMDASIGRPWASVSYHKSMSGDMGMNMFRGFVVDLLAAFLLVWLLLKFETLDMKTALQTSLVVGFIGYLTIPYLNSVWFEGSTIAHLIDAVVQWGLVGLWLGWWLPRR